MAITVPDIVGLVGVACVVVTYFLTQVGRMSPNEPLYPAVNAISALMILVSLYFGRIHPPS
ncbi:MAG: hypothetical protein R3C40_06190 [Parvularculaceae bacterium]